MTENVFDRPLVSIIVPCRNEAGYIREFIESIINQKEPKGGFEVIIADGMSDDGTREILTSMSKQEPRLRWVNNEKQITPTGLNKAILHARGDIIIRMDVHTEYAGDYIIRCLEVLETTGADNVGGPWKAVGHSIVSRAIAVVFQSRFGAGTGNAHDTLYQGPLDTVYLGCWKRELFDKIGFFDEELVRNQDDEFNLRIIRSGGTVWQDPGIKSTYTPRSSLRALFKQYRQYGYWKVRVIQKHRAVASWRHLVPGLFVLGMTGMPAASVLLRLCNLMTKSEWLRLLGRFIEICMVLCISSYVILDIIASIKAAVKEDWRLFPLVCLVFPVYHVSYGIGFLEGIRDFYLLRRGGQSGMTDLSR